MLLLSAILTTILLTIVFRFYAARSRPGKPILITAVLGGLAGLGCLGIYPAHVLSAVAVFIVGCLAFYQTNRQSIFVPWTLIGTAFAYGICALIAYTETRDLLNRYPYVTLAERLPLIPQPGGRPGRVWESDLDSLENDIQIRQAPFIFNRGKALQALHEETTGFFLSRPGFGVGRMPRFPEGLFQRDERDGSPVPQPTVRRSPWRTDADPDKELAGDLHGLQESHHASVLDFVHQAGFGYLKDRDHVAGFQSHQFSKEPEMSRTFRLRSLDLIGLVVHATPCAYVSENLPRMDELRAAPTRPLDPFEEAGLAKLRQGETLFVREHGRQVRMLGAIRAAKQCVDCHGGQRGDLLGAFSYTLALRR